jgi:proteasome accessory factor A
MTMAKHKSQNETVRALPKLCGADIELCNFIAGTELAGGTGYEASRALLAEIKGMPIRQSGYLDSAWSVPSTAPRAGAYTGAETYAPASGWGYNLQDVGRRFLPGSGASAYIDLDHLEICTSETLSAFDHVAALHAMLRIARGALDRANEGRAVDRRIKLLANNSDSMGHSYGSHVSFQINRHTFDNIFWRKPHYLQFLASFQVSSILLTGQGKAGSENGQPYTPYQISQRADFFETLQGVQTTFNRPIVNARDEALCGRAFSGQAEPARLHVIFHDSGLAHGTCLLRTGASQLLLVLLELGLVNSRLILDDPLAALQRFSHDPSLKARSELITGQRFTALELQSACLDEVRRHAARGVFQGVVPRFDEIISLWEDTLNKFSRGDLMALAPRLDWVMKLMAIERAMDDNPGLDWDSPEIKMIDLLYSSLDEDGLYRAYEASGFTEQLIPPGRIDYFTENPPGDTRAWTRAMLLRRASSDDVDVDSVDWDRITFKIRGRYSWPSYRAFEMANPLGFTKAEAQPIFDSCLDFGDLLDGLESLASGIALPAYANAVN